MHMNNNYYNLVIVISYLMVSINLEFFLPSERNRARRPMCLAAHQRPSFDWLIRVWGVVIIYSNFKEDGRKVTIDAILCTFMDILRRITQYLVNILHYYRIVICLITRNSGLFG